MNEVQGKVLDLLGMMTVRNEAQLLSSAANKSSQSEPDSFQKMMDKTAQKTESSAAKVESKPADSQKPAQKEEAPSAEAEEVVTQEQMQMAAMAAMQAVVIPVDVQEAAPQAEVDAALAQTMVSGDAAGLSQAASQGQMEVPEEQVSKETVLQTEQQAASHTELPQEKTVAKALEGQADTANTSERETADQNLDAEVAAEPQQKLFQDVKTVPVKVGEAPAAEDAQNAGDVQNQLAGKLTETLQNGESRVQIQLMPENLGKVNVEITRSADGALRVVLAAENAQTRSLLDQHVTSLQNLLGSQNREPVQVEVYHGQEAQQENQDQGYQDNEHHGRHQEQQRRQSEPEGQDFLQRLRLGLIPLEGESA